MSVGIRIQMHRRRDYILLGKPIYLIFQFQFLDRKLINPPTKAISADAYEYGYLNIPIKH